MKAILPASIVLFAILLSGERTVAVDQTGANDAKTKVASKKRAKQNPAFAMPAIDPDLPNVLLIGDSISIGYTLATRAALAGTANVIRPAMNCGPTTRGLDQIDRWLGDRHWDVIHFNFGLHDLKFMGPGGQNLADPADENSRRQVPLSQYQANLRQLVQRLRQTGATLIWRETTPVPKGAAGRLVADVDRYNGAANQIMIQAGDIRVDPMYEFAMRHSAMQRPNNVHYTVEGSTVLGEHVADVIKETLVSDR